MHFHIICSLTSNSWVATSFAPPMCSGESVVTFFVTAVIYALKILSAADRPVDRAGTDAQHALRSHPSAQTDRVLRGPILLIKVKIGMWRITQTLKQLNRLRLDTLGTVDDHDRRVGRHQGTVGILREILMSWCIQDIDAESFIIKLQ